MATTLVGIVTVVLTICAGGAGQFADTGLNENPQAQARQSDRRKVVEPRDEYDRTPLMRAAARGDLAAAQESVAKGADVNATTAEGYTALMFAAFLGNANIVKLLVENGAAVNASDDNGLTALIEAAKQHMDHGDVIAEYVGTVEALLKGGADVSPRDKTGSTALMYAEKYGLRNKQEIVRLLIDAGPKPNVPAAAIRPMQMENEISLDGTNLTYYSRSFVDECKADCENNAMCRGFTWIKAGTYNPGDAAMCYLMSAVTRKIPTRGHLSGVKE